MKFYTDEIIQKQVQLAVIPVIIIIYLKPHFLLLMITHPRRKIIAGITIFFLLVFFFILLVKPAYTITTDNPYMSGILGPYAFEDDNTGDIQSFVKLFGYPTFNNLTSIDDSVWYLEVRYNVEDSYQLNQRVEIQIFASARYGNNSNTKWSYLPDEFLSLDNSTIHFLYSRSNLEYTFNNFSPDLQDDYTFLGGISVSEKNNFDRTLIDEKIELTLLLNNVVVKQWYYGNCEQLKCINQLRIKIQIQFLEQSFLGKWKTVEATEYILGNGEPSLDMDYFQIVPET